MCAHIPEQEGDARLIDAEVNSYVENIHKLGGVVNTAIILGVTEGILGNKDRRPFDALQSLCEIYWELQN